MPQKPPAIGEDVSHLFAGVGGSAPAVGEDVTHLFTAQGGLYDPNRKPASTEDFYQAKRDVSPGAMALNAVKSLNPVPAVQAMIADQRPEDAMMGPAGAVLGPLGRAAKSGIQSEAQKAAEAARQGRGWEAAGHAAATFAPLVGPAAASAGEDIGSGDPERIERGGGNAIGLVGGMVAPAALAKVAPRVAPAMATIGEQLASKGQTLKAAAGKVNPVVLDIAAEAAGHAMGAPFGLSALARRVLASSLESARKPAAAAANAGGRLVKAGSATSAESELADVLEQLRGTARPESVELPPLAELPPGYTPRSTVPEPMPSPNAGGRLVAPKAPTTEQALADALAEARAPQPPTRVTTAPAPSLPPGYAPRTTVPKARQAKAALPEPVQKAIAAGEKKRAYFLKSQEDIAAAAESVPGVAPSGSISPKDLPASWRSHTGQDLFPTTGAEGKEIAQALVAELKAKGVSVGEAMAAVSKNKAIPTKERAQLIRALGKAYTTVR